MPKKSIFDYPLKEVEVSENITRQDFDAGVRQRGKPILLKGLVKDWPIIEASHQSMDKLAEYMKGLDVGAVVSAFIAPPEIGGRYFYSPDMKTFNFQSKNLQFTEVLNSLIAQRTNPTPPGIYAGASVTANTMPQFGKYNKMPLVGDNVPPRAWVSNSATIAPHFDISENIACLVSGARKFVIFPPEQIGNLYVGPIDHNMAGQPASLVDLENIDLEKFPKFEAAIESATLVNLDPGDALYIPSLWWHFVKSEGPLNVLVNYWFDELGDGSPMNVLALALLVMRDLPQSYKSAWLHVFKHYVFEHESGAATDHIPADLKGVLGDKSQPRDQKIKTFLRNQLPSVLM